MITARHFSSCPSDSTSRWTPCPPEYRRRWLQVHLAVSSFRLRARLGFSIPTIFSGKRGVTRAFGYSAPPSSTGGILTLLNNALLSAHYELLRHPNRPSLPSRDSGWITSIDLRFPCYARSPFMHTVATTPTEMLTRIARYHQHLRPSLFISQVGFCITLFEACSAFTHVTACMIAESPISDPFHQRLRRLHFFHRCSDCCRLER